jgi:ABC-type antimicrobial peptide transport system permease subunit
MIPVLNLVLQGTTHAVKSSVLIFVVLDLPPQVLRVLNARLAAVSCHGVDSSLDELLDEGILLLAEIVAIELSGAIDRRPI